MMKLPYSHVAISPFSDQQTLAWLAGVLEGEGSFMFSEKHKSLILTVQMTDEDVIARIAGIWSSAISKANVKQSHHKTPFSTKLVGARAAYFMNLLLPFMGERRASKIREVIEKYQCALATRKELLTSRALMTDVELHHAWTHRNTKLSFRKFCEAHGLSNRKSVQNRLVRMGLMPAAPTSNNVAATDTSSVSDKVTAEHDNAWLAGLLEGEGCFSNNGGSIYVSLQMTDKDVVERVAMLCGTTAVFQPSESEKWLPIYRCVVYSHRAEIVMRKILPWMGARRTARIQECLAIRTASQKRLAEEKSAFAIAREASLPAAELTARWTSRVAPANLSSFAREYGVHPQIMKNRLVELGVYSSPAYKSRTNVTHTCGFCSTPFVRKASARGGKYCSRVCSGRAV